MIDTPIRICDLSEGGCFIDSMHDAPTPGTILDIRIDLPSAGWISAHGRALEPRPGFGFAMEFTALSPSDRAHLAAAVAGLRDTVSR